MRAVLTAHGIRVHISGENHAAMVGLGASAITQAVWVPREDAEAASALITEMREGGVTALADDEVPEDDTAERDETLTDDGAVVTPAQDTLGSLGKRKRIILAVLVGCFLGHGTAHMSARAWKRGFLLAGLQIYGWVMLASGKRHLGVAIVLATMAMDVLGAIIEIAQSSPASLPTARVQRRR